MDPKEIAGRAEAFLMAAGFDGTRAIDMLALMDATIGRENVRFLPAHKMPRSTCAALIDARITLRRGMSDEDNRYYFARELAKIALAIDVSIGSMHELDVEAFADHVLVPRRVLTEFRAKISSEAQRVADAFVCPLRVAKRRLAEDCAQLRLVHARDGFVDVKTLSHQASEKRMRGGR